MSPYTLLASCSIILSWFRLGFGGLSPYSFGILFHHHFLVPARIPGFVSLLFWHPVPSSFPGSCLDSGACLPTLLASCSIISWFLLGFRGLSPYTLLASCSIIISWFLLGFRGLSPYSFGILFHHFLVPAEVPGLVSLYSFGILFHHFLVPARVPGLVGILFHHFLVPARVPGLVSLLSGILFRVPGIVSVFFWHSVPSHFLVLARVPGLVSLFFRHPVQSSCPGSCWGSGACLPILFWHPVPSFPGSC